MGQDLKRSERRCRAQSSAGRSGSISWTSEKRAYSWEAVTALQECLSRSVQCSRFLSEHSQSPDSWYSNANYHCFKCVLRQVTTTHCTAFALAVPVQYPGTRQLRRCRAFHHPHCTVHCSRFDSISGYTLLIEFCYTVASPYCHFICLCTSYRHSILRSRQQSTMHLYQTLVIACTLRRQVLHWSVFFGILRQSRHHLKQVRRQLGFCLLGLQLQLPPVRLQPLLL